MKAFTKTYGPAILSGALLAYSFPGFHLYLLAWVALVPLFYATRDASPRVCFARFLLAGYVFHGIVHQWLLTHFYWVGGVAFLGHQLIVLYLAFFWGVMGALWAWMRRLLPRSLAPVLIAVLWAAMEYLQSTLFTGFGWSSLGYSQGKDLVLLQVASLGGATLISALLVLVNALLAEVLALRGARRLVPGAVALTLVLAAHGIGYTLLDTPDYTSRPLKVGILQSNFPQEMKLDSEYALDMVIRASEKSRMLASRSPVDVFVWPESLIIESLNPNSQTVVESLTRDTGAALFSGATRDTETGDGEYNSSVMFDRQGQLVDYYDKIHLAPFGEYVPLAYYLPFLRSIVPVADLAYGDTPKVFKVDGRTLGPLICFEVLFGPMSEALRRQGADFLVVITNLGWFGHSNALTQELEIARMRAVETRLPLVHSANTGISGVFDPWGRFEPLRAYIDESGTYWEVPDPGVEEIMIMNRGIQAFDVAVPGDRPLPFAPGFFPLLALAFSAIAAVVAGYRARRRTSPPPQ